MKEKHTSLELSPRRKSAVWQFISGAEEQGLFAGLDKEHKFVLYAHWKYGLTGDTIASYLGVKTRATPSQIQRNAYNIIIDNFPESHRDQVRERLNKTLKEELKLRLSHSMQFAPIDTEFNEMLTHVQLYRSRRMVKLRSAADTSS